MVAAAAPIVAGGGTMTTQLSTPEQPNPYEVLPYSIDQQLVLDGMQAYLDFLHLPLDQRRLLHHVDTTRPRTGESGYMPKTHANQDNKDVFHMTQALGQHFPENHHGLPQEAQNFLSIARIIHEELNKVAKEVLQAWEVDENLPGLSNMHFPANGRREHHSRFVAYQGGRGRHLATAHYDKSTATIAVAESHGGLRIGYSAEDLTLLNRDQFQPIIFPGYGWHQLRTAQGQSTRRQPAWHDVIDTGERVAADVCRWALVHFINPADRYLDSSLAETHTPLPNNLGQLALQTS